MCYKVVCNGCSKYTWGGCGKHLKSVYASIDTGNHCSCRPWPGVVIPTGTENPTAATASATTTASASEKGASVGNVWSLSSIIRAMIGNSLLSLIFFLLFFSVGSSYRAPIRKAILVTYLLLYT